MKHHFFFTIFILFLACFIVGCAEPAVILEQPPSKTLVPTVETPTNTPTAPPPTPPATSTNTATPEPIPTNTPTPRPTEVPTLEATPTNTPIPFGRLYVCNYYEGDKVGAFLHIKRDDGTYIDQWNALVRNDGCETRKLIPGSYIVSVTWGYEDVHCWSEEYPIEMQSIGRVELDIDIICP
jgi:hypothetical protein